MEYDALIFKYKFGLLKLINNLVIQTPEVYNIYVGCQAVWPYNNNMYNKFVKK